MDSPYNIQTLFLVGISMDKTLTNPQILFFDLGIFIFLGSK